MGIRKILYVDMDNVLVDFESAIAQLPAEILEAFAGRLDEVPDIFSTMGPIEGAVEAYAILAKRFDTYILSTAPWENASAWRDKLGWVKSHLGAHAHKRLILTHHKNLNVGDYLIDDRTKNGVDKFQGEHIHFGTQRFPNWPSVVDYLLGGSAESPTSDGG
jgi:5'-nucleotidase